MAFLQETEANYAAETSAMLGGYIGGAEGVAVASVAYVLLAMLAYETNYHLSFPVTLMDTISTTREMIWAVSISSQAVARNINLPFFNLGYMANGPATENYFYEAAAYIPASIPTGVTCQTPFPSKAVQTDGMTPQEVLLHTKMADAAAKITRSRANEIVNRLMEKYEGSLSSPERGLSYPACFDIKKNQPNDRYMRLYEKVKGELVKMGVDFG